MTKKSASARAASQQPGIDSKSEPLPRATACDALIPESETAGFPAQMVALNEALVLAAVRQHELAATAESSNVRLQREVDERQRTEAALKESQERYRALFNALPVAAFVCDREATIQYYNRRAAELWQREPKIGFEQHCGSIKLYLKNGAFLPHAQSPMMEVLRTGMSARNVEVSIERPDGSRIPVIVNFAALKNAQGEVTGVVTAFDDITELRQAAEALQRAQAQLTDRAGQLAGLVTERTLELTATNQRLEASIESIKQGKEEYRQLFLEGQTMQGKLSQLTRQIITAQEEERKEISRELHDEVVQTLVGINVELAALNKGNSVGVLHLKQKIAHTQRIVENSVNAVHRFARGLRPAVLDDLGLIPALHAFSKNLTGRKKLKIRITAFGGAEELGGAERTVLFRVAQEALTNVVRHAHATQVELNIREVSGMVRMEIRDNGQSFPVEKTIQAKSNRLGLVGMKERIEMVGGTLSIGSAVGQGTTVRAEIPFTHDKPKN